MLTSTTKKRLAAGLAATALGASLALGSSGSPAGADPTQLSAYVGVGSDTTQDVMNALSGFNVGKSYTAINSGATGNYKHIISFDAAPAQSASDNCITPVINGPTFTRPNGSGAGRKALAAANGQTAWTGKVFALDNGSTLPICATSVNLQGAVQFARSSALASTAGSDVVFVPFGRDAMSFASYRPGGGTPLTTLTRKQLIDIFNSPTLLTVADPDGAGTLTVIPCGIQTSSGTHQFWRDTVVKSTSAKEAAATLTCTPTEVSRLQESKGDLLKIKGDALDATFNDFVVISGYSAAAYIAQANLVSVANGFNEVVLGEISDDSEAGTGGTNLGSPLVGTAPNLTPNPTFFASAGHGRDVYNVIKRSNLVNTGTGVQLNNAYTALFAGPTSAICSTAGQTTVNKFGFASIAACGSLALARGYEAGAS